MHFINKNMIVIQLLFSPSLASLISNHTVSCMYKVMLIACKISQVKQTYTLHSFFHFLSLATTAPKSSAPITCMCVCLSRYHLLFLESHCSLDSPVLLIIEITSTLLSLHTLIISICPSYIRNFNLAFNSANQSIVCRVRPHPPPPPHHHSPHQARVFHMIYIHYT